MVCSAADTMLEVGALHTMMPRSVAASTSTLSTPTPARPMILRFDAGLDDLARRLRGRAHDERVVGAGSRRRAAPASGRS